MHLVVLNGAFVYAHYLHGASTPFYIGTTQKPKIRPYCKCGRNKKWNEIAANGFEVKILASNIMLWEALRLEAELVHKHRNTVTNSYVETSHAERLERWFNYGEYKKYKAMIYEFTPAKNEGHENRKGVDF